MIIGARRYFLITSRGLGLVALSAADPEEPWIEKKASMLHKDGEDGSKMVRTMCELLTSWSTGSK